MNPNSDDSGTQYKRNPLNGYHNGISNVSHSNFKVMHTMDPERYKPRKYVNTKNVPNNRVQACQNTIPFSIKPQQIQPEEIKFKPYHKDSPLPQPTSHYQFSFPNEYHQKQPSINFQNLDLPTIPEDCISCSLHNNPIQYQHPQHPSNRHHQERTSFDSAAMIPTRQQNGLGEELITYHKSPVSIENGYTPHHQINLDFNPVCRAVVIH